MWNAWRLKIVRKQKLLFWKKSFFKMISLFAVFVSKDRKQLDSRLYGATLQFYAENALKMQRMWKLANYADLHHCILLDAL